MKVAMLGAGFMGSTHAKAYAQVPGVELGPIYAHSGDRAQPLAEELGTTWTDDLDSVLADDSVDAIDNCLPTPQHREITVQALKAGKHVLLEKPIALTVEDAEALVQAGEESDRLLLMAHVLRFWPEYIEIARGVEAGEIGVPVSGFAYRRQPFPAWSKLFSQSDKTGGAVVDQMIHDFDALNWIFGSPRAVTAKGIKNKRSGGWDQVQVLIDYGTSSALVDGGMMMPESYPFSSTFQVLGDDGAMEYMFRAGGRSVEMGEGVNELTLFPNSGDPEIVEVAQKDPYLAEVEYFAECVESGAAGERATPLDATVALKVALAARQSLESGKTESIES